MSKVLVIGCGGVASVAISKCCQISDVFTELCIASRTKSKCDALAAKLAPNTKTKITTAQVDADDVQQLCDLINSYKPDLVMNIALPYQDLTIMDACLACGVNYMDTANYEPENTDDPEWRAIYEKRCKEAGFSAYFDYSWQWAYAKKFEEAGLTALLGSGFDPGVTQAYCAYAKKHEFDTIDTIDILDCNGGDHGYAFATNFNPEINLREVSAPGSYWENGHWVEIPAMSIKREYDFDKVGQKDMYLLHHEEIESLAKNIPASVTIKGWISRYATRKPCTIPKARPIATAISIEMNTLPPPKSRYTAQLILTSATTPPTEISIPPVIMTKLIPQESMIRAALAFRILKNVCGFKKPFPWNTIAPIYIAKNTTIVMVSSRLVSVIFFNFLPISANLLYGLTLLQLLANSGQPLSYLWRA